MEHVQTLADVAQPLFDLVVTIGSSCFLDYVFVADHGLSEIDCIIQSLDWESPEVTVTCELASL